MSVYHKWKTVFVQIPKNATNSIHNNLSNRTDMLLNHASYFQILNENDAELIESYFSFAVVRNPYDRLVSAFEYSKQTNLVSLDENFDEFIKKLEGRSMNFFVDLPVYFTPQYKYITIKSHILVDYIIRFENLKDDWKKVACIINENIKKRHMSVGKTYSYLSDKLQITNVTQTRLVDNIYKRLEDYYTNPETKEIAWDLYKKDFEIFKYEK